MKFIIILTMLTSLTACGSGSGSGSNATSNSSAIDQNVGVSKFEESKFGSSKFN